MKKKVTAIVHVVDFTKKPNVYATNNPAYYLKYCIDLFPESIPTLAPFESEKEAHEKLIELFGEEQHKAWFPEIYAQPYTTCTGCYGYKPTEEMQLGYCATCRHILSAL